jgi:hypothetical protein
MANTQKAMKDLVSEIVRIAKSQVGVREVGNTNCGEIVNQYKAATWLNPKKGWPWCAAFVCWVIREALASSGTKQTKTFKRPRTAGAWDFENWSIAQDSTTWLRRKPAGDIVPGDIVIFTFSHIGIAVSSPDKMGNISTVEGNTDSAGSREGGGVYLKTRNLSKIRSRIRFNLPSKVA